MEENAYRDPAEFGENIKEPELPAWRWRPAGCDQFAVAENAYYQGKGNRKERRKNFTMIRLAVKRLRRAQKNAK